MNARASDANPDVRERAVATLFKPVDDARAVFRGLVIVGHRVSVEQGEMVWALPGGIRQRTAALQSADPSFTVIEQPTEHYLLEQQPVLKALVS